MSYPLGINADKLDGLHAAQIIYEARKWGGGGPAAGLPCSFLVSKVGNLYQALNGATGKIDHSDLDAAVVIQAAVNALQSLGGGSIYLKNLTLPSSVTYTSSVRIIEDYQGRVMDTSLPEIVIKKDSVTDFLSVLETYQGKKTIVIPAGDGFTLDEKAIITKIGTKIVNIPPRTCKITLTANGYFSIENPDADGDWETRSWVLEDLRIDGNHVATRAITTEYGASQRRTYQPKILNCRIVNMDYDDTVKAIVLRNCEAFKVADCSLGWGLAHSTTRGIGIHIYNSGTRAIGWGELHHNEIFLDDGTNGAIGVRLGHTVATGGGIGAPTSIANHFIGTTLIDSLAFDVVGKAGVTVNDLDSRGDRFEMCRLFDVSVDAGTLNNFDISGCRSSANNIAVATYLIHLTASLKRCTIIGNRIGSGGGSTHNDSRAIYNEGVGTNSDANQILMNEIGWAKTEGVNKSYLDGAVGHKVMTRSNMCSDGLATDRDI